MWVPLFRYNTLVQTILNSLLSTKVKFIAYMFFISNTSQIHPIREWFQIYSFFTLEVNCFVNMGYRLLFILEVNCLMFRKGSEVHEQDWLVADWLLWWKHMEEPNCTEAEAIFGKMQTSNPEQFWNCLLRCIFNQALKLLPYLMITLLWNSVTHHDLVIKNLYD
jgi:hypothetical protein